MGNEIVASAVEFAAPHSDADKAVLAEIGAQFMTAHAVTPSGFSLEVGTRAGGTAALMLTLLDKIYPESIRPMLFSVDPYGGKPYKGGDVIYTTHREMTGNKYAAPGGLYNNDLFSAAKILLAPWQNHAHFLLPSLEFLKLMRDATFWVRSSKEYLSRNITFALLDGDHDADTIFQEAWALFRYYMRPSGIVVVDNVDKDRRSVDLLREKFVFEIACNGELAIIRGLK